MRRSMLLSYMVFIMLFSLSLFAQQAQLLKIVAPSPTQISQENIVSFVIEADKSTVDLITITTDANATFNIQVNPNKTHYCKTINLHLGENIIDVAGYKSNTLVSEQKRKVFLESKVHKEYRYPPQQYKREYFHNETNEKVCASCHDMSVNEVKGVAFKDVTKSNCYQCHNQVASKKHAHAPSVNWLCTSCHNGKVGTFNEADRNKSKYTVPDPIGPLCFSCHEKNEEKWGDKRFTHEPTEAGRCNKCHNSHSEENEFYLRKDSWNLCTGCHKDKIEGMHIVKTFGRKAHPTHNVKDPSRPGKDLSCISCHNPHASNASFLLQSESVMGICSRCHKK
ncbi:cytochrome c3 family protein [Sulfurimonas sp.]|uniref:cytochrome c3 family protein n=1 Tax=Sulfurimonas sp. TaxID=2022749 RepID=UPI0026378028|nr:cytochrome c3 family protein [Sulfurimonas sp.]MCW8895598.1 cytochrome c3 family protein [Sulfurimonas sp.]MCW9067148.1 cytochrome c3 family protein [Sulfurimonas sp.]